MLLHSFSQIHAASFSPDLTPPTAIGLEKEAFPVIFLLEIRKCHTMRDIGYIVKITDNLKVIILLSFVNLL